MFNLFNKFTSQKRTYLDNAAATPMSDFVMAEIEKIKKENIFANPSAIYKSGVRAKEIIESSRKKLLTYFRAEGMNLIFTSSATESINIFLLGTLKSGDHLITSAVEHPSVLEVARFLAKEKGVQVTYLDVDEEGFIKKEQLRTALKANTKVVSIMMVNNEIGTVQNIKEIGKIIVDYNRDNNSHIRFHSDVCQAINYFDIDMRAMRLDAITLNGSKNYAGKGSGALIYRKDIHIEPTSYGGGQERGLRSGTENIEAIVALERGVYECKSLLLKEKERLLALQKYFFTEIKKEIPEAIICGPINNLEHQNVRENVVVRSPNNINIILPGLISEEAIIRLDYYGFEISHKSACASLPAQAGRESEGGSYVLEAIGKSKKELVENIRITMGRDTTRKDLEKLITKMKEIYYKYRAL